MSDPTTIDAPGSGESPAERASRLASHYNDAGRPELAEREAKRGLSMEPESYDLHLELARSHFLREQWKPAEKVTLRLLELAPESPMALQMLAALRMGQGSYGEAESLVLQALKLAPEWARLYELYGDLMDRTGHTEKAKRLYERARALDPNDADIHAKLGILEAARNRHDAAEEHARRGLNVGPTEALAHISLGNTMLLRGRPFAARKHFREALRLDPGEASYEELWLETDKLCRVIYLPMYYWGLVIARLPGHQFGAWGLFLLFAFVAPSLGVPKGVVGGVALAYIGLCLYTWIAGPLLKLWLKIRPPDLERE